jgi:hypothetical protein
MTTLNCQQSARWNPPPPPDPEVRVPQPVADNLPRSQVKSVRDYLDCPLTRTLEAKYGSRWERMHKYSKLTFRAALSLYGFWSHWCAAAPPKELIAEAIEQTNSDLRLDDPDLYSAIASCIELPIQEIEKLLQALGEQIREECWSTDALSAS